MMKRALRTLLAVCLSLSLLPMVALAEGPEENVSVVKPDGTVASYPSLMTALGQVSDGDTVRVLKDYREESGYDIASGEENNYGLPSYAAHVDDGAMRLTLPEGHNKFRLELGEHRVQSLYLYSFSGGEITATATAPGGVVNPEGGDKISGIGSTGGNKLVVEGGAYTGLLCDENSHMTVRGANADALVLMGGEMEVESGSFGMAQILVDNAPSLKLTSGDFSGEMFGENTGMGILFHSEESGDPAAAANIFLSSVTAASKALANIQTQQEVTAVKSDGMAYFPSPLTLSSKITCQDPQAASGAEATVLYTDSAGKLSGVSLPTLTHDTLTFDGWFTAQAGGEAVTAETVFAQSATIYARWTDPSVPPHTHTWADTWEKDETHHWHECSAEGCDVTENSGKGGYSQHTKAWVKTNATQHWKSCTTCGWTSDKADHTFGGWSVTQEATTSTKGSKERTCTVCGYKETAEIPTVSTGSSSSRYRRPAAKWPFTDVKTTDDCYESVKYIYEKKWMEGTSATTFAPEGELTRAMFATVLYRAAGSPGATGVLAFTDAKTDTWYSTAILWATQSGVLRGYGDGRFGPEDPVSVEMLNMVLARQKGEEPQWVGDPALARSATRAEIAQAMMETTRK